MSYEKSRTRCSKQIPLGLARTASLLCHIRSTYVQKVATFFPCCFPGKVYEKQVLTRLVQIAPKLNGTAYASMSSNRLTTSTHYGRLSLERKRLRSRAHLQRPHIEGSTNVRAKRNRHL